MVNVNKLEIPRILSYGNIKHTFKHVFEIERPIINPCSVNGSWVQISPETRLFILDWLVVRYNVSINIHLN